jgi:hypothetical protein
MCCTCSCTCLRLSSALSTRDAKSSLSMRLLYVRRVSSCWACSLALAILFSLAASKASLLLRFVSLIKTYSLRMVLYCSSHLVLSSSYCWASIKASSLAFAYARRMA